MKLKHTQVEMSEIRNKFMVLNTYACELDYNIKNKQKKQEILNVITKYSQKQQ